MSLKLSISIAVIAAGLALQPGVARAEGPKLLSLSQAVDLALSQNAKLQATRRMTGASRDSADSVRGHLLPLVKVGLTYDYVKANEGLNLGGLLGGASSSSGSSGAAAPPPYYINFWGGDFNVTVAQPILGLLHTSQDWQAAVRSADAAGDDVKTAEAEVRTQVELGLLQLFEARAVKGIAEASHEQLAQQLTIAEAKLKDGAFTKADVLRFQVAAANASQQIISAEVDEDNAKDTLLGLIGLLGEDRGSLDFVDPSNEVWGRAMPPEHGVDAEHLAESQRPELLSASHQYDAAWHRKESGYFKLLPEFNLAYSYYRLINTPSAFPTDINLFGISASWNIWEWGADYYAAHSASEQLEAASLQREALRQQIDVEVRLREAQEHAAGTAVQVASDTIAQAEEAFRVTQVTVRAGAATTTDLLDAQSALTQAKLNLARARYQQLRARSTLFRALGAQ